MILSVDPQVIDNATLLIAIGFSSAALLLALLISWSNSRGDRYLVSWASGIGCVVIAVAIQGLSNGRFTLDIQLTAYSFLICGMALICVGTLQFAEHRARSTNLFWLWLSAMLSMNLAFLLGFSGPGLILLNLWCALFLALSGQHYWRARGEFPLQMIASAILFGVHSLSFVACAVVLLLEGNLVVLAPPNNWAEQFNSIMAIIGLTGLGALALTLNQSRLTRRHRQEAQTDVLTGLLNRRALFERFELDDLPPHTAVLMFDIDHFKQINDQQGHSTGDSVIRHFAMIMARGVRNHDVTARLGGEEFCAVLLDISPDEAASVAELIRRDFEDHSAHLLVQKLPATVSAGVASSVGSEAFSTVLNRADAALYAAKRSGRNRVTRSAPRQAA